MRRLVVKVLKNETILVVGFQRIGVFRIIGSRLLHHVKTARGLVLTLIALPFFSGMLITTASVLLIAAIGAALFGATRYYRKPHHKG